MEKKHCRRVVIRLYNPDTIEHVDTLPRGLKSPIIEFALKEFFESRRGKDIYDHLKYRNNIPENILT